VEFVAFVIGLQFAPFVSQRDHWYANEVGLPCQLPVDTVSVWPTCTDPLMVVVPDSVMDGAVVFVGTVFVGTATGTGLVSHHLRTPERGSPKVALLQATPPVNVLGAVKVPFAP
jgi:hypothetical protein